MVLYFEAIVYVSISAVAPRCNQESQRSVRTSVRYAGRCDRSAQQSTGLSGAGTV